RARAVPGGGAVRVRHAAQRRTGAAAVHRHRVRTRLLAAADAVRADGGGVPLRLPAGIPVAAGADARGLGRPLPAPLRLTGAQSRSGAGRSGYAWGMDASGQAERARALVGWRLLALLYDALPVLALWMLVSAAFTAGYTFLGHHDPRENIAPFSLLWWLLWLACWLVAGAYATASWRRGGQTLGMRPWRLRMVGADGGAPAWRALAVRYAVGTLSLLAAGLGFWWAWLDRDRLAWHDRASGTRLQRLPKRPRGG